MPSPRAPKVPKIPSYLAATLPKSRYILTPTPLQMLLPAAEIVHCLATDGIPKIERKGKRRKRKRRRKKNKWKVVTDATTGEPTIQYPNSTTTPENNNNPSKALTLPGFGLYHPTATPTLSLTNNIVPSLHGHSVTKLGTLTAVLKRWDLTHDIDDVGNTPGLCRGRSGHEQGMKGTSTNTTTTVTTSAASPTSPAPHPTPTRPSSRPPAHARSPAHTRVETLIDFSRSNTFSLALSAKARKEVVRKQRAETARLAAAAAKREAARVNNVAKNVGMFRGRAALVGKLSRSFGGNGSEGGGTIVKETSPPPRKNGRKSGRKSGRKETVVSAATKVNGAETGESDSCTASDDFESMEEDEDDDFFDEGGMNESIDSQTVAKDAATSCLSSPPRSSPRRKAVVVVEPAKQTPTLDRQVSYGVHPSSSITLTPYPTDHAQFFKGATDSGAAQPQHHGSPHPPHRPCLSHGTAPHRPSLAVIATDHDHHLNVSQLRQLNRMNLLNLQLERNTQALLQSESHVRRASHLLHAGADHHEQHLKMVKKHWCERWLSLVVMAAAASKLAENMALLRYLGDQEQEEEEEVAVTVESAVAAGAVVHHSVPPPQQSFTQGLLLEAFSSKRPRSHAELLVNMATFKVASHTLGCAARRYLDKKYKDKKTRTIRSLGFMLHTKIKWFKHDYRERQATTIINFVRDTKFNSAVFASVVYSFRVAVTKCQVTAKGFLAVRKARVDLLKSWWHDSERVWIATWKLKKKVFEANNPAMVTPAPKRVRDQILMDCLNKAMKNHMLVLRKHHMMVRENELQVTKLGIADALAVIKGDALQVESKKITFVLPFFSFFSMIGKRGMNEMIKKAHIEMDAYQNEMDRESGIVLMQKAEDVLVGLRGDIALWGDLNESESGGEGDDDDFFSESGGFGGPRRRASSSASGGGRSRFGSEDSSGSRGRSRSRSGGRISVIFGGLAASKGGEHAMEAKKRRMSQFEGNHQTSFSNM